MPSSFYSQYRVHPLVSSLKEESSDESTIISSQTSTLTRNQGPEDMEVHAEEHSEGHAEGGADDTLKRNMSGAELHDEFEEECEEVGGVYD